MAQVRHGGGGFEAQVGASQGRDSVPKYHVVGVLQKNVAWAIIRACWLAPPARNPSHALEPAKAFGPNLFGGQAEAAGCGCVCGEGEGGRLCLHVCGVCGGEPVHEVVGGKRLCLHVCVWCVCGGSLCVPVCEVGGGKRLCLHVCVCVVVCVCVPSLCTPPPMPLPRYTDEVH